MNFVLDKISAVSFQNKIDAGDERIFEAYDPQTNSWEKMPAPTNFYRRKYLVIFEDKHMLIEGAIHDEENVEYFGFTTNYWIKVENMNLKRFCYCVAVVKKILNNFEYLT